ANGIKAVVDITPESPAQTLITKLCDPTYRVTDPRSLAIGEGGMAETRVDDRVEHGLDGAFHHSVPGRAEQQDPLAVCLGDRHPAEPTRSVGSVAKTPGEASDVLFRALCEALHGPGANPVFPIRLPNMAPRV